MDKRKYHKPWKVIGTGNRDKQLLGVYCLPHEAEDLLFDIWILNQMRHLSGELATLHQHKDTRDVARRLGWIIDAAHNIAVDRLRSYMPDWNDARRKRRPQSMADFYNLLGQVIVNEAVIEAKKEISRDQKRSGQP
jgi:hypothetical protein